MDECYFWCNLKNGAKRTCGYIAERGAVVGHKIELVDMDGEFWEVTTVDPVPVPKGLVRTNEKRYKGFQASLKGGGIK